MKKYLVWGGGILVVAFLLIQVKRPDRSNPPVDAAMVYSTHMSVPDSVNSIITRACYDCHSNETKWPWYSSVAPISWLVAQDVEQGRRHLNFSEWGKMKKGRMIKKLSDIEGEVTDHSMPLPKYLKLHPEAVLTDADREVLSKWAIEQGRKLGGDE
jgi:hypothetical protein